jgi:hypothetical protein
MWRWKMYEGFGHSMCEALFIAAALTLTVDPFLKRRLVQDAAKDIFHHLLGFSLPEQIRERLKTIVEETRLYRKDMVMDASFSVVDNVRMHIDIATAYEVINPSCETIGFRQVLDFEKAENAHLKKVWCSEGKREYGKAAALQLNDDGGTIYVGKEIKVSPSRTGKRYRFLAEYSVEGFSVPDGFYTQMFKYPTIGVTLRITARPQSLKFGTDLGSLVNDVCVTERLFMPGDHITIRWESLAGDGAQSSC